ncbi:MAG TPA: polysaccharide deacetylase family protein [Thermodesulfobacteriota bacterium]|nr:polysaccharide deacetylase family protein [Thermodesulfobacteriota bacterium]
MRSNIHKLGSKLIAGTKIPQLFHKVAYRHELTILMYHGTIRSPLAVPDWCFLDEQSFRLQIGSLKKHFEIIALSEAVERMRTGAIKRPTAAITFDDGYQNNFDVAFPILRREKIPATIFLATGLIDTTDTVWHCRLNLALSQTRRPVMDRNGFQFDLSTLNLKAKASAAIQENLKTLPHPQLMATLRNIILDLDGDPDCSIGVNSPYGMLNRNAIAEMVASGLIEFGAHTHQHAILSRLSERERFNEIRRSVDAVYELTGRPCRCFSYPNGRAEDYDVASIRHLEACGIQMAVTTTAGPNNKTTPVMELRRYGIGADLPMAEFHLTVGHFYYKSLQLLRGAQRHPRDRKEA